MKQIKETIIWLEKLGYDCPNCDNTGSYPDKDGSQVQCQWCYEWPGSKFQVRKELLALLKLVAEKQRSTCVQHYCGTDKGGTIYIISSTPLVTDELLKEIHP